MKMRTVSAYVVMSDAVANFYSRPSGQQGTSSKQMGGAMSNYGKYSIPLWKDVKKQIVEMVPSAASKLDGSNKLSGKVSKDLRSMDSRRILEKSVSGTHTKKFQPKKRKMKKKVRFSDDEEPKYKRSRQSQISQALGYDTY